MLERNRGEIQTMFFFPYQGILGLISIKMGERMTQSQERKSAEGGNLIFLSPSVPHTCAEDSFFINVNVSRYFPYYFDQRWSVQSGLSGQLQNPFFLKKKKSYDILHLT